jgi:hypothetical protein
MLSDVLAGAAGKLASSVPLPGGQLGLMARIGGGDPCSLLRVSLDTLHVL